MTGGVGKSRIWSDSDAYYKRLANSSLSCQRHKLHHQVEMATAGTADRSTILSFLLTSWSDAVPLASGAACFGSYAATWTPKAALPDGSGLFDHCSSHAIAVAVLHATLGPPGTVNLAEFCMIKEQRG